jgi:hypothetical protein
LFKGGAQWLLRLNMPLEGKEKKMKLINYNKETKEFTLKMDQEEFLDLFSLSDGVANTASLQDFTALGVFEDRVYELANEFRRILKNK